MPYVPLQPAETIPLKASSAEQSTWCCTSLEQEPGTRQQGSSRGQEHARRALHFLPQLCGKPRSRALLRKDSGGWLLASKNRPPGTARTSLLCLPTLHLRKNGRFLHFPRSTNYQQDHAQVHLCVASFLSQNSRRPEEKHTNTSTRDQRCTARHLPPAFWVKQEGKWCTFLTTV